ncbi:MAG TPA: hypothetical protein VGR03_00830, partial [Candidatus Acidoferrum sp.]|nr:hypothetical protein [Candidatus Acidoferrum sp.]
AAIKPSQNEPVQHELARLARILRYLYDGTNLGAIACAEIAAKALLQEEPHVVLARETVDSLETHFRRGPFAAMLRGGSAPARVILGLGLLLYIGLPSGYFLFRRISGIKEILGINVSMLIGVALAGALGSIVSIMVRLQDFVSVHVKDPTVVFFTGFFKPIVGMSFAMFVFACLNAGILPLAIKVDTPAAGYFFLALGFVSGFSERFAQDVASRAEKSIK